MIETEFKKIRVETGKRLSDDEVRISIEDNDPYGFGDARLNLIWLKENEVGKLITYLREAKKRLEQKRERMDEIIKTTDLIHLEAEFERKYNQYPVNMAPSEAFGRALEDGLIDQDTYDAAKRYNGRLWNYVGD